MGTRRWWSMFSADRVGAAAQTAMFDENLRPQPAPNGVDGGYTGDIRPFATA